MSEDVKGIEGYSAAVDIASPYDAMPESEYVGQSNQAQGVMICGNVSLLTPEAIQKASDSYQVVVVGKSAPQIQNTKHLRYYDSVSSDEVLGQMLVAHEIDVVWYISGYADGGDGLEDEISMLNTIFESCKKNAVTKFIAVSSVEALNYNPKYSLTGELIGQEYVSGNAFAASQMEQYVRFMAKSIGMKSIILRVPYIENSDNTENYLGSVFKKMETGEEIKFPYLSDTEIDIISEYDLVEAMLDITDVYTDVSAVYTLSSGFKAAWNDIENQIAQIAPEAKITYLGNNCLIPHQDYSKELKERYGFIPIVNVVNSIEASYEKYRSFNKKESWVKKIFSQINADLRRKFVGYIELVIFYLVMIGLIEVTGTGAVFKWVDIRLFYVLMMGSTHGLMIGVLAGMLASASLAISFVAEGVSFDMLFFNVENWLPIVIFLMTGSITGYIRSSHDTERAFIKKENEELRDKYLFLSKVYRGAIENKGDYKRQILGYKDSFGVIFEAVKKLDDDLPERIFINGIQVLENLLKNHSIAIYTLDDWQKFARLTACSAEMMTKLGKSLEMSTVQPVYKTVMEGAVWKNTNLIEGLPMFAYGIKKNDKVALMVFLWNANSEQQSLYYTNLFQILGNLIQMSFLRALEYQYAIEKERYIEGTTIAKPEYFKEIIRANENLMDAGLSSYAILLMDSSDMNYVTEITRGMIRNSDTLGMDINGRIYLLLTQVDSKSIEFVKKRFDTRGIKFTVYTGKVDL